MSLNVSRRGFLATGIEARLVLASGATVHADSGAVPPVLTGDRTLAIAASSHRFHRDLGDAPTWSYGNQEYLGPTIQAHTGEPITLVFRNTLGAHLFAADVDPNLDGASEQDRTDLPSSAAAA